jgi:Tol biopolymer transport system component
VKVLRALALALLGSWIAVVLLTGAARATAATSDRLVFVTAGEEVYGRLEIASINSDGTGFRRLTRHDPSGFAPRWTSDGRGIVFLTFDDFSDLYGQWSVSADGKRFHHLPAGAVSPSGRWIAQPSRRGVDILTPTGRRVRRLTLPLGRGDFQGLDPTWSTWSHDERTLAATVATENADGEVISARVFVLATDGSAPPRALRPRRTGQFEVALSWSPDDRTLAIDHGGSSDYTTIVLVSRDNWRRRRLVADANGSAVHAWSPDAGAIAYVRQDGAILTISARDGRTRLVTHPEATREEAGDVELAWSRGGRLAFSDAAGIHSVRPDRRRPVTLLSGEGAFSRVDWSPDGRRLVFSDRYELLVVRATGGGLQRLTRALQDESPVWSADQSRIAFVRGARRLADPSRISVYVMRANGAGVRRVGRGYGPVWAPQGHRLAYVDVLPDDPAGMATLRAGRIIVADDDEGTSRQVAVGTAPTWSPDGTQLAYLRYEFEAYDTWRGERAKAVGAALWIIGADGGGQRKLLDASDPGWSGLWERYDEEDGEIPTPLPGTPSWSPDGRWIALSAARRSALVDPTTGEVQRLDAPLGRWCPDGKRLLVVDDDYPDRLVVVDVATAARRTIDRARDEFSHKFPVWSPDGSHVAFVGCYSSDCDVYVVGSDGRGRKRITHTLGIESSLDWAPTR